MKSTARYPKYKDSGIEWLGEIPAHWEVVRLKYHAQFDNSGIWGDEPETCDAPIPVARTADISIDGRINFQDMPMRCLSAAEMKAYKCRPGEIIVVKSSGSVSNVVTGKAALVTQEMPTFSFSNFLLRVIPSQVVWDSRFLYAFLTSHMVRKRIELMVSGTTYPNLKVSEYRGFEVPLPNRPEQRAIANFLDRETAKIDGLVEKKERLIELLKEKRIALISHAVTKGLDPNVPMKDSGIEWLGNIPAHWMVRKWSHCCQIAEGQVPPADEQYRDRVLIAPNHVESGTGKIIKLETADAQGAVSGKYLVRPGDIIYSKIRPALNKACIATGDWLCSADMYPVRISDRSLKPRFLLYYILSEAFVKLMVDESMRVAMPKVNRETLTAAPVLVPKQDEQDAIVQHLDRETAKIDALIGKIEKAIGLLKEYRTALISAAVTGKMDVRDGGKEGQSLRPKRQD